MSVDVGERILRLLETQHELDSLEIGEKLGVDHQVIVGAVKSLQSLGNVSIQGIDCVPEMSLPATHQSNLTESAFHHTQQ